MFFVSKLTWEYGEEYGHVYYPTNMVDLRKKISELNEWGLKKGYPFFIMMQLTDGSFLGFTVAHEYSFVEFNFNNAGNLEGPYHLLNTNGNVDEIVPVYYGASHTEPDTTKMLPIKQVLEAIYHYVQYRIFPSKIQFSSEVANKKFVSTQQ